MKVYLASRYSRREELCGYREILSASGIHVTGRWLNGGHQVDDQGQQIGEAGEALFEQGHLIAAKFAQDDLDDVVAADALIAFTEEPRSDKGRGGRHVEFGIALALGKPIYIVGPRENVFHWLPAVARVFDDFHDLCGWLDVSILGRATGVAPWGAS